MEAGGDQGEAKIVAPSACATSPLPSSAVQALVSAVWVDDVQVVGAMRRRMIVRPRSPLAVPYKAEICAFCIGPDQASEAPKPRIICSAVPKSTVAVLTTEVTVSDTLAVAVLWWVVSVGVKVTESVTVPGVDSTVPAGGE